jgi:hypothetical protein
MVATLALQRDRTPEAAATALGALLWVIGNAMWTAHWPLFVVTPWWLGFLLLSLLLQTVGFVGQWRVTAAGLPLPDGQRLVGLALAAVRLRLARCGRTGHAPRRNGRACHRRRVSRARHAAAGGGLLGAVAVLLGTAGAR